MSKRRPAPWVPLSVYYFDDAALMEAGEFAEVMFTRMMAYAGRHRGWNGRLPRSVVLTRLGLVALEGAPESAPEVRLERLLESGLVSAQGTAICINGWLKWNESGEQTEAVREADRDRKTSATRADAQDRSEAVPESAPESGTSSGTVSSAQDKTRKEEKKNAGFDPLGAGFDEWWQLYPKKENKKAAEARWKTITKTVEPSDLIAGLERYAAELRRHGTERRFIKGPDVWLNKGCWTDEYDNTQEEVLEWHQMR
jgi:hypothetical protein